MVFWAFENLLGAKGIGEHVSCIRGKQAETAVKKKKNLGMIYAYFIRHIV